MRGERENTHSGTLEEEYQVKCRNVEESTLFSGLCPFSLGKIPTSYLPSFEAMIIGSIWVQSAGLNTGKDVIGQSVFYTLPHCCWLDLAEWEIVLWLQVQQHIFSDLSVKFCTTDETGSSVGVVSILVNIHLLCGDMN